MYKLYILVSLLCFVQCDYSFYRDKKWKCQRLLVPGVLPQYYNKPSSLYDTVEKLEKLHDITSALWAKPGEYTALYQYRTELLLASHYIDLNLYLLLEKIKKHEKQAKELVFNFTKKVRIPHNSLGDYMRELNSILVERHYRSKMFAFSLTNICSDRFYNVNDRYKICKDTYLANILCAWQTAMHSANAITAILDKLNITN